MLAVLAGLFLAFVASVARADDPPLPALTGRIVDRAELLLDATESALTAKLAAHEQATGNQVVVVTLPDLMGRTASDWGLMLGRAWGIGQAGKDNGIVLLVAPNEREVRIEVGYGLEGTMPDAIANGIIQNEIIPQFKAADMEAGIVGGTDAILGVLSGTYAPATDPVADAGGPNWSEIADRYLPFIFVLLFITVGFASSLRRRWDKKLERYVWYMAANRSSSSDFGSSGSSSSGGFSGGGGSFGGGGAGGKW